MTSLTDNLFMMLEELQNHGFEVYISGQHIRETMKKNAGEMTGLFNVMNLENKIIRTTEPYKKFTENPMLILKCLSCASMLNLNLDNEISEAVHNSAALLNNVPIEKIKEEFVKILCGNNAENILRTYSDIIEIFIPEIRNMYNFDQHTPYHKYDVWEHTLHAIGISENTPLIRTVMFFHDIAKPDCFTIDKDGIGHFKGHALLGAEKTEKILKRLKFSSEEIKNITILIANHRYNYKCDADVKRIMNAVGSERFFTLIKVKRADDCSKGVSGEINKNLDFAERKAIEILNKNEFYQKCNMKINAEDLSRLGFKKAHIDNILNILYENIIYGYLENDSTNLLDYAYSIK